ncbi:autotransporter outer membrane beta-barrel domain-containing protein [Pseudomonas putida]|uniref:Autotransporter outer membrane beta-barrel domain-containing protein n=1 Tax=Pseudomonas putida TaxID=303 RepID=A0A6I6XX14_PSEPU|nr:autotransporter outer membrane beta-barrel domain-containing protein [Pseudomonas putida]QHG63930.1 autotransporter outer membrane beta-barrel domain-containing protein [Pseudomonas putida]
MKKTSFQLKFCHSVAYCATVLPMALYGPDAMAAQAIIERDTVIDASSPLVGYQVLKGVKLTGNGASTQQIFLREGGALELNSSSIVAAGDGLLMEGGAQAIINGSSIISEDRGIAVARSSAGGSAAWLNGSTVAGSNGGASIASTSELHLNGSTVTGVGKGSAGVRMFNGWLEAQGSQIVGAQEGILVNADNVSGEARIDLSGSQVVGQDGAAIVVAGGRLGAAAATITVSNGSQLSGSNGNLLEVRNDSAGKLIVENANLTGNIWAEQGSSVAVALGTHATLTGQLENVETLAIGNQSRWVMVDNATVGNLSLDGGTVQFGLPAAYHRLTLDSLSGNGTFIMDADFATGQTDFLDITGNASGNHGLLIGSSGAEPQQEGQFQVVHTGGGDASFSLVNGPVDLGAFSYELTQRGNDWYLDGSRKIISPGTRSVLALFNTAPTVWYGELTSLRSRMGELRLDQGKAGGWLRTYGNKYDVAASSGVAYKQTQQGFSLGADAPLPMGDGQWLLGVLAGHSRSDLDLSGGTSGEIDSYYLGLYTTWLDSASGYYFDGVVKFNRFDNDSKVALSDGTRTKGSYNNQGIGLSAEFGRHIELGQGYFVEPFTQWATAYIQGKDYHLDNGLQADGDDVRSMLGKAGATVGRNFNTAQGRVIQPYLRAAYAHEFINNNDVKVNEHRFANDLSGSRLELGAGVAVTVADRLQMHVDLDHSLGEHIDQPWGVNLGLRFSW